MQLPYRVFLQCQSNYNLYYKKILTQSNYFLKQFLSFYLVIFLQINLIAINKTLIFLQGFLESLLKLIKINQSNLIKEDTL